ncbi:MAG: hypothetical protein KA327_07775, partial [Pseudarcicella sp.]|nr:hypothetical protein [Pseudarcicella sp.]
MFKTHPSFYIFLLSTILLFTSNIGFGQCPARGVDAPGNFVIKHSLFDVSKDYSVYEGRDALGNITNVVPATDDGVNNEPYRICKGTTLTVVPYTSGASFTNAKFVFDYNTSNMPSPSYWSIKNTADRKYEYKTVGKYYLMMSIIGGAGTYYACKVIEVVDPNIAPNVTLKSCSDSEIEVIFPADPNERPFEKYEITMGGSSTFLLDHPFSPTDRTNEAIYKQSSGVLGETNVEVKVKGVVNDEEACLANKTPLAEFSQFVTVGAPLPAHTLKSLEEVDGTPNRFKLSY